MSKRQRRRSVRVLSCGAVPFFQSDNGSLQFLIIQHHAGHWGFPKGRKERGESYEETAKREVEEEVGQKGKFLTKLSFESRFPIRYGMKRVVWFLTKFSNQDVRITNELRAWRWGSYEETARCLTHEQDRRVLQEALKYIKRRTDPSFVLEKKHYVHHQPLDQKRPPKKRRPPSDRKKISEHRSPSGQKRPPKKRHLPSNQNRPPSDKKQPSKKRRPSSDQKKVSEPHPPPPEQKRFAE